MGDYDKCARYHESIQMACGGIRKDHAERYPGHSFVEPLNEPRVNAAIIENIVNGVSITCENATTRQPATITVRDSKGKTQAVITAVAGNELVAFRQVCFVSNSITTTKEETIK